MNDLLPSFVHLSHLVTFDHLTKNKEYKTIFTKLICNILAILGFFAVFKTWHIKLCDEPSSLEQRSFVRNLVMGVEGLRAKCRILFRSFEVVNDPIISRALILHLHLIYTVLNTR